VHAHTRLGAPDRFGGGARFDVWCQIFADVLNRPVRQAADPILAKVPGAALLAAVGLGHIRAEDIPTPVRHKQVHQPQFRALCDEPYGAFLELYRLNRGLYAWLNRRGCRPAAVGGRRRMATSTEEGGRHGQVQALIEA